METSYSCLKCIVMGKDLFFFVVFFSVMNGSAFTCYSIPFLPIFGHLVYIWDYLMSLLNPSPFCISLISPIYKLNFSILSKGNS